MLLEMEYMLVVKWTLKTLDVMTTK